MADVLFRTAFLLLHAAAWLLVFATLLTLRLTWMLARWTWRTAPPLVGRIRDARRLRRWPTEQRTLSSGVALR